LLAQQLGQRPEERLAAARAVVVADGALKRIAVFHEPLHGAAQGLFHRRQVRRVAAAEQQHAAATAGQGGADVVHQLQNAAAAAKALAEIGEAHVYCAALKPGMSGPR